MRLPRLPLTARPSSVAGTLVTVLLAVVICLLIRRGNHSSSMAVGRDQEAAHALTDERPASAVGAVADDDTFSLVIARSAGRPAPAATLT